jgi:hypothetical protein
VYLLGMPSNDKPRLDRSQLEDKIEHNVLPVLYVTAVVLVCFMLLGLVVLVWKEAF